MKPLLIFVALFAAVTMHRFWIGPALDDLAGASLDADAHRALDLRCGAPEHRASHACRARLGRLFASGALDPERTLRAHCEEIVAAPWGRAHPAPPPICSERFGM